MSSFLVKNENILFPRFSKLESVEVLAEQRDLQMISSLKEATDKEGMLLLCQEQLPHKLPLTSKYFVCLLF